MTSHSLGLIFPGQGSQSIGMLRDIAEEFSEVQAIFAEASQLLGYDLWQLASNGPAEELDKTIHTQPILLTASYAIWQILKTKKNINPVVMAGHSLGEYTALVCAEAMTFPAALKLVTARAQFMQEAVPPGKGALAAIIGLEDITVKKVCELAKQGDEVLSLANLNCPGQIVIAGHTHSVERALVLAKAEGAKLTKLLPVSVPSHCILMKSASEKLTPILIDTVIQKPKIPVINNVDVEIYDSPGTIRDGLIRQMFMPVRWTEIIQKFVKQGVKEVIECGPGKVLTSLNKRISNEITIANTADLTSLHSLSENALEKR